VSDDIRPRGIVERTCSRCSWSMWFDPLHPAELVALRRFRDGILGLRAEMAAAVAPELDQPIETIDALLTMSWPVKIGGTGG
jgi:hypothetical protein